MSRVNLPRNEGPDNPSGVNEVGSRHPSTTRAPDYLYCKAHRRYLCNECDIPQPPPRETCEAPEDSPGSAHLRGATGRLEFTPTSARKREESGA
jgi:hypothetical protein